MCHVLIIEDQALIALDLEDLLAAHGAESFSFASCQKSAVAAAHATPPDVILSDVSLAEGSGPLAVQEILETLGPIPVIFVTATPEACPDLISAREVFRKPLDRPMIGAAFRKMAFV